ncbi:hypothetical protein EYR40_006631 [Pleurotus pulmonarius]|nr:hypothetical protein EYR36_011252 [Pleurotus pulmonarius]KAF4598279.1 hypothetical protein EYR38_006675 [Pleurotus pulmonarius]KAF4599537.1 hypothetical protein EYR40_006631 [Pleurotus pulmonarius]
MLQSDSQGFNVKAIPAKITPMLNNNLIPILDTTLASIKPGEPIHDDIFHQLRVLFPDNLVLAAFDIVDRKNVMKYTTSWGRVFYQVIGSKATYSVQPDLGHSPSIRFYCTCPAFSYNVLLSESYCMCKHILAVELAEQLNECTDRPSDPNDIANLVAR